MHPSLDCGSMEKIRVFLPLLKPSNAGLLPPQGFFLLSACFNFSPEDLLLVLPIFFRTVLKRMERKIQPRQGRLQQGSRLDSNVFPPYGILEGGDFKGYMQQPRDLHQSF